MGNLLATLTTAAGSLRAVERALTVVQNNVSNASTMGYARQRISLEAQPFQPEIPLLGGVLARGLISSRTQYAEQAVWLQSSRFGRASQHTASLSQLEPVFDITDGTGLASMIDRLYKSFSQLTVTPNDLPARQNVISTATDLARTFNYSASLTFRASEQADREIRSQVEAINRLAGTVRDINIELRNDARKLDDAGLDARLHSSLEELSEFVDFNVLRQEDGTFTILLGGQMPLTMGDRLFEIQPDFSSSQTRILNAEGKDVTSHIQQGRLSALLDLKNNMIPSFLQDLNRLAESIADRVNGLLQGGVDANGLPPALDLFSYDSTNGSALTLAVNPLQPTDLAAALPTAPGGNGNALNLAALATSKEIDGYTFTEFYGRLASRVGSSLATARGNERTQSLLLSQARTFRGELSSVSLDEEAANLIQFQRAYQASARLISVLNEMTETLMGILR